MSQIAAVTLRRWWQTVIDHTPVNGRCPVCHIRRCRTGAEAFGDLVAHDLWQCGPPPDLREAWAARTSKRRSTMQQLRFERPNRCDNSGPNCVEVAVDEATGTRYVRDSKNEAGPVLTFDRDEWAAFTGSVRAGQF